MRKIEFIITDDNKLDYNMDDDITCFDLLLMSRYLDRIINSMMDNAEVED
jgi:hypothetical protein